MFTAARGISWIAKHNLQYCSTYRGRFAELSVLSTHDAMGTKKANCLGRSWALLGVPACSCGVCIWVFEKPKVSAGVRPWVSVATRHLARAGRAARVSRARGAPQMPGRCCFWALGRQFDRALRGTRCFMARGRVGRMTSVFGARSDGAAACRLGAFGEVAARCSRQAHAGASADRARQDQVRASANIEDLPSQARQRGIAPGARWHLEVTARASWRGPSG